jgi:hypothetical protein
MKAYNYYSNECSNYGSESVSSIVPGKSFILKMNITNIKHEIVVDVKKG